MPAPEYLRQLAAETKGEIKCWIEQAADARVQAEEKRVQAEAKSKMTFWETLAAALNLTSQSNESFGACAAVADRWARAQLAGTKRQFRRDFDKGIPEDTILAQKKYALSSEQQLKQQKEKALSTMGMQTEARNALLRRATTLQQQATLPGANVPAILAEMHEITARLRKLGHFISNTYQDFYSPKAIQDSISQEAAENILLNKEDEQSITSVAFVAKTITDTVDKHVGCAYSFSISKDKSHHRIAASHLIRNKTLVECIEDGGHLSKFRFLDANTGEWVYTSYYDFEKFLAKYFELIYSSYVGGTMSIHRYSLA